MFARLLLVAAVASASNETAFRGWMSTYSKTYPTVALFEQRLAAFLENDRIINEHNEHNAQTTA